RITMFKSQVVSIATSTSFPRMMVVDSTISRPPSGQSARVTTTMWSLLSPIARSTVFAAAKIRRIALSTSRIMDARRCWVAI
ncbi:hypothetical protein BGZ58_007042, partial [Dissophora ornata]